MKRENSGFGKSQPAMASLSHTQIEERMENEEGEVEGEKTRIYVGGLGEKVTSDDLSNIFSSLGLVKSVEIVRTKSRSFAYLDFCPSQPNSLSKLFSKYNGCVWKGGKLRLEKAKEHYLTRLNREWSEDAQAASSPPPIHQPMASSEKASVKPNKLVHSENKMLKLFFPRLYKVKSLPFTGTGKHKYSFQRVVVPPLPTYFCDCEEHLVRYDTAKGKRICDHAAEEHNEIHDPESVMNEEELNIINSVMNKLFERGNASNAAGSGTGQANDGHDFIEDMEFAENEADEDNLITNVVSRGNNGMASSRFQQKTTILGKNQRLTSGETPTSKDRPTHNVLKVQKMNSSPSTKKRKLLNEESIENESLSIKPVGDMNMHTRPNKSRTLLQAQPAETQSGFKQLNTNHSWSQKMSWKTLVGDKDNSIFSVSNILPAFTPTKEVDNTLESIEDMQFDENAIDGDDLVINVVSKKNNRKTLSKSQEQETVSTANQKSTFSETQTFTVGHVESVPKVQKKSPAHNKKRKSLLNGEGDRKEFGFASSEVDGSLQTDTNKSGMLTVTGVQPAEPVIISVGDKGNDALSDSNMFPYMSSNEGQATFGETQTSTVGDVEDVPKVQKKSTACNKKRKSLLNGESDRKEFVLASSEVDGSLQTDTNESGMLTGAQPAEPESHVKQSITDHSRSPSVITVGDKGNDAFSVSNMLPYISTNEGQPTSDSPDNPESTEKNLVEVPAESQPTENNAASNKSGRGLSWFQKSPWTQMVNENTSSFSITQISPSIDFEKHEVTKPYMGKDTENLNKKDSTRYVSMALEGEKEGEVIKQFSEKNKQTTVSSESGTSALIVENKSDSMLRKTCDNGEVSIAIGETCSFMRSATSIKEWAKTKAAISGSDKRKSIEK